MHRDHLKTGKISCRNPFRVDEGLINYNLDSEDEWAEENGEDIDAEKNSEEEESDDEQSENNNGFIVDDGYLSVSEMMDSDDE